MKTITFKAFICLFVNLFLCSSAMLWAQEVESIEGGDSGYAYPFRDPYLASVTTAFLRPSTNHKEVHSLRLFPNRDVLEPIGNRNEAHISLYRSLPGSPLIFMIPGFSGHAYAPMTSFLAEQWSQRGYHVAVLPSPFFWRFPLAASSTGIVGDIPTDSRDLYRLIRKVHRLLIDEASLSFSRLGLVGFSLGALQAAFVADIDDSVAPFSLGFDLVYLMNPPLNLHYAARQLDALYRVGNRWSISERQEIWRKAISGALSDEVHNNPLKPETIHQVVQELHLDQDMLKYIIGRQFRYSLADAVFVTQVVQNRGVLPVNQGLDLGRRLARKFSFENYLRKILLPFLTEKEPQLTAEEMNRRSSFFAKMDYLAKAPHVWVTHTKDDFLVQTSDLESLSKRLKNRVKIYPRGGHLGNIWYIENQNDFLAKLSELLKSET